jgi:hypothetical protein
VARKIRYRWWFDLGLIDLDTILLSVSIQNFVWTPSPPNLALEPRGGIYGHLQSTNHLPQPVLLDLHPFLQLFNRLQSQASSQNVSKVSSRAEIMHLDHSWRAGGTWMKKWLLYEPPPNSPIDSTIDVLSSHVTAAPLHSPWHVRQSLLLHSSH